MFDIYASKPEVEVVDHEESKYSEFITLVTGVANLIQSSEAKEAGSNERSIPSCLCASGVFPQLLELVPGEHKECRDLQDSLIAIVEDSLGLTTYQADKFVRALIRR